MRVKNLCENAKYIVKKTDTPMEHLEKKKYRYYHISSFIYQNSDRCGGHVT